MIQGRMFAMCAYDRKSLLVYTSILVFVLIVMKYTQGYGFAIIIPFILVSLARGRNEDLFFYLILAGTIVVGNNNLMPKNAIVFIMQRGILAFLACAMAIKVFNGCLPVILRPFLWLLMYLVFMLLPSALGWCPLVSFLKLLLFSGCFFAYLGTACAFAQEGRMDIRKLRSIFLALAIFYVLGSVCLIPFPSISQLEPDKYVEMLMAGRHVTSLFTGMTNMSQCLGPVVAAVACLLFGDLVFGIRRFDKLYALLLLCCPLLVYKTSSRTALGTLGIGFLSVFYFVIKARNISSVWKSRVLSSCVGLGFLAVVTVMCSAGIRQSAMNFVMKWGGDDVRSADLSYESVYMTRQGKIEDGIYHFKQSPVIGNGFQVSEQMQGFSASSLKDMLSAPVEKGVWVTAILEEGGVIGMSIFIIFLMSAVHCFVKNKAYLSCCVLMTFMAANLGEFMFFSMSYTGGFMWAVMFLALVLDEARIQEARFFGGYMWHNGR